MQNIFRFFQKYSTVFIFLILQLICVLFIFSKNNPYQHSKFANSSNQIVGAIYTSINSIRQYFHLKEENELLLSQNLLLQEETKAHEIIIGSYFSRKEDTLYMQQYFYQTATVIQASKDKVYNFLTLNKGSSNDVNKNMGVVGTKGIVGYVVATSNHYATVLPIINPNFILSIRHKKTKSFGILEWTEGNTFETATINDISDFIKINIGDTIETTGGDGFFPEGQLVGTVKQTEEIPGKGTQLITIQLMENYGNIHHVYTINNITQIELEKLKDSTQINE